MLVELFPDTSYADIEELIRRFSCMGFHVVRQGGHRLALVSGIDSLVVTDDFKFLPHVANVYPLTSRYKLASRQCQIEDTVIDIRGVKIGGRNLLLAGGPCSIESREQLTLCAKAAKKSGEFQGMGMEGIILISEIAHEYDLISISEVMDIDQAHSASPYLDILQIGARNVQNYSLLKELGKLPNPILLKRGFATTYQELLMSAEYLMSAGNPNIILCERGIRTFETYTRNTLDLNAVPSLQELTHLPVMVDPSHGTGVRSLVPVMARAAIAAGASGILVEMHPDPDKSVSDAAQTLSFATFDKMMNEVRLIHKTMQEFKHEQGGV
jgi:3-deoxy-7-phosphoheptulonate synthase